MAVAALALVAVLVGLGVLIGSQLGGDGGGARSAGGVVVVVLLLVVAGRIMVSVVGPLTRIAATVDDVAEGDLSARAPTAGPRPVRRLGASVNAMATRLEADDDRRRQLLADVAHELRTPLSVVRGNVEGIVDGVYEPDHARLARVLTELARVDRLLEDLRTLSNADVGALAVDSEEVRLAALVERVVTAHRDAAGDRGAALRVEVDEAGRAAVVDGDPARLAQVLGNLLDNARRHARGATAVVVALTATADAAVLTVTDDGTTPPAEVIAGAFERFSTGADTGGTGLGLPIVRRLVERHGGTAELAAGPDGRGTTATVRLPLA